MRPPRLTPPSSCAPTTVTATATTSALLPPPLFLSPITRSHPQISTPNFNSLLRASYSVSLNPQFSKNKPSWWFCSSTLSNSSSSSANNSKSEEVTAISSEEVQVLPQNQWSVGVGQPNVPSSYLPAMAKLSLTDRAFFLLAFIGCTTSVAFTSLVVAAVPTLFAMRRAAISLSKLADTTREELPSTMTAIRLSGMEISDLTLELSDLSQEIADGVSKSTQIVQAAEEGIRQIGSSARQQTVSMIEERANLPDISLKPVVAGAAKKTSRAVGQATKTFLNLISGGDFNNSKDQDDNTMDRLDV